MLTNIYVIDYMLKDLDGAKNRLDRVFGTEPLWIHPDMTPGQVMRAMYYQIPGNGEMSHALGLFQEGGDTIRVKQDKLYLIGIMCDDMERTMSEMTARGLKFLHAEANRYAVGESNSLGMLHGVEFFIARHIPGGDLKAREMMFTKDGSSNFGDDTQGGLFKGFLGIDFAVADFEKAIATFTAILDTPPKDTTARTNAPGVRSAHFPAPGHGRGMREVGVFARIGGGEGKLAERIGRFLQQDGDGIFRMDLAVTDVSAMRQLLAARGIQLPVGGDAVLEDIHGTDLRYVQL